MEDPSEKREDDFDGPSIVFTGKADVDETSFRKTTNICKSFVGIDASQLYSYSMCQPMPTGHYMRWYRNSETGRLTTRQYTTSSLGNTVMSYLQRIRPECKIESFYTRGRQKKIDCFSVDRFCFLCNTVLEAVGCFYPFCFFQEVRISLSEEDIKLGHQKREIDALRRSNLPGNVFTVLGIWECE